MTGEWLAFRVTGDECGERLDMFVSKVASVSRSRSQRLISSGSVVVDGSPSKKNHRLSEGEEVRCLIEEDALPDVEPEPLPLDVVYEDEHLIVVDKNAGMVMYPGPGHPGGTLLNAALYRYPEIARLQGRGRPGIVHRLDRDTSGLVAVARNKEAFSKMVEMISTGQVERRYLALAVGRLPSKEGIIEAPMARSKRNRKRMAVDAVSGRRAVTAFRVIERFDGYDLLEVELQTGRTHQIRVHLSHMGYPVAGDRDYSRARSSKRLGLSRQFLHAYKLDFEHPDSGSMMSFTSPLPEELKVTLSSLRGRK